MGWWLVAAKADQNFVWRDGNLSVNANTASGDLTVEWSTAHNLEQQTAMYPVPFTRDASGTWRYAGENWVTFSSEHFRVRALPNVVAVAQALISNLPDIYTHVTTV